MQDIQDRKTFESPTPLSTSQPLPWKRIAFCAKLLAATVVFIAIVVLLPQRPHLYFDLGVAVLLIIAIVWGARFSLRQYIERPHAEMGSLMHGVAAAGAIFGVLAVALTGDAGGVDEVLRLTISFSVVSVLVAAWTLFAGILVYWPVHFISTKLFKLSFRSQAVAIGAVAGLLAFSPLFATTGLHWAIAAGTLLTAVCTHRAAAMHRRYTRRKLQGE